MLDEARSTATLGYQLSLVVLTSPVALTDTTLVRQFVLEDDMVCTRAAHFGLQSCEPVMTLQAARIANALRLPLEADNNLALRLAHENADDPLTEYLMQDTKVRVLAQPRVRYTVRSH